jgi:hypothetical protein
MLSLYDFVTEHGRNDIAEWIDQLQKPDRARLEQKLTRLVQISFELAKETHLLAGPVYRGIWKLRVNASVMLRPHLCKGPINKDHEYTLLVGAIESGDHLPDHIEKTAFRRQGEVEADPLTRRISHGAPPWGAK